MLKYLNPKNYWNKAVYYWEKVRYESSWDLEHVQQAERQKFSEAGFDYNKALAQLDTVLDSMGKPCFAEQTGMASVHWLLFSALSQFAKIKTILEIGTFDGETAFLLSKLFPHSTIVTIDLPKDDPIYVASYQRDDPVYRREFEAKQTRNLSDSRITFLQTNSFFLPSTVQQTFDLVWVDGSHVYPEISWDICNAYHVCSKGGYVMCDDVYRIPNIQHEYASSDSHEILEYVAQRTQDTLYYFLKREGAEWSANPKKRKFVAMLHKQK